MRHPSRWICALVALVVLLPWGHAVARAHAHGSPGLADTTVLIIRHAEKPARGMGLAPQGIERARAYVRYFQDFAFDGVRLRPDTLIASADSRHSVRPRLTLEPLAHALGLPLETDFRDRQTQALAKALRTRAHGATVLICWHHGKLLRLVRALGGDPAALLPGGKWPSDVYDWVVVLRYDRQGRLSDEHLVHEHLMPGDR